MFASISCRTSDSDKLEGLGSVPHMTSYIEYFSIIQDPGRPSQVANITALSRILPNLVHLKLDSFKRWETQPDPQKTHGYKCSGVEDQASYLDN